MTQCGTMGKTLQRSDDNFDHGGRVEVGDGVGGGEESSCQQITIMIKLKIKLKKTKTGEIIFMLKIRIQYSYQMKSITDKKNE